MEATIPYEAVFVPLTAALGLSLMVERVLELAQNLLESLLGKKEQGVIAPESDAVEQLEKLTELYESDAELQKQEADAGAAAQERADLMAKLEAETDPGKRMEIQKKLAEFEAGAELDEHYPPQVFLVETATDPDDGKTLKKFILQLLGFAAGIFLAHYAGLQLFNSILGAMGKPEISKALDYLMTGLLIGGGSAPMHVLVRFITERKFTAAPTKTGVESAESEEKQHVPQKTEAPAVITKPAGDVIVESNWGDIPYRGGVDRDLLENVHIRKKDPDMIVYHHTAMHSNSTFEDVVRVIKSRKTPGGKNWLTGYHCVILADGSIHPFCRWDRYGNHAAGFNMQSLGITFNGNFETGTKDRWSNADGRYGLKRPTEAQLEAGVRVVTLWTLLYSIDPDFENSIIPHKQIATKACPGSNFPYDEFKRKVEHYRKQWEKSGAIQDRIEAFKLKPYLYVKGEV
jgi:hypothetical protein